MPDEIFVRRRRIEEEQTAPIRPRRRLLNPLDLAPRWIPPRRRPRAAENEPDARPRARPRWNPQLFPREIALTQDLHAFAKAGYRLFALNLETGTETQLGFITPTGPRYIAGIILDDGMYEFHVRADGHYWHDARFNTTTRFTIVDGMIATDTQLPALLNLAYELQGETVYLSWRWESADGIAAPENFAVWASSSEPVDVSGDPGYVIPGTPPGSITTIIASDPSTIYVAVRARRDSALGPISTIAVLPQDAESNSPENQSARYRFKR